MFKSKKQRVRLAVLLGCTLFCANASATPKWRTAYLANQNTIPGALTYQPLSAVPWGKYTHVIQASVVPTAINGVPGIDTSAYCITTCISNNTVVQGNAQAFVDAAHTGGAKALVSLIVGSKQAAVMESNTNSTNIAGFVDVLSTFINDNGYDGIDVDWEAYTSMSIYSSQFPEFIRLLREAMPTKVIAVAGGVQFRNVYKTAYADGSHVFDKVDQINLMNYDMDTRLYSGSPSPTTWFNTAVRRDPNWPFDSASNNYGNNKTQEENLMYVTAYGSILPLAKFGLGVPFYGYVRQAPLDATHGVTAPLQYYAAAGIGTTPYIRSPIAYSQLVTPRCVDPQDPYGAGLPPVGNPPYCADGSQLQSRTLTNSLAGSATSPGYRAWVPFYDPIFKRTWDDKFKAPYVSYAAGAAEDAFVTYTDSQQIQESVKLAKEQGLGGMMVFAINQEYLSDQAGDDRYPLTMSMATDLAVKASSNVSQVNVNGQIVYTVVASNAGPAMASGVTVADALPSGMTYISANVTQGSCNADNGTVSCSIGNLDSGASATISITVTPTVAGNVTNNIAVKGDDYDPNLPNNSASVTTTVNPVTDLAVSLSATPNPVNQGSSITYTATVTNNGPSAASNVSVTGLTGCTLSSSSIPSGGTASCTVSVVANAAGTLTQTVSVSGTEYDPNANNNTAPVTVTVNPSADLAITLSGSPNPVVLGQSVTYTTTVTNLGPSTSAGSTVSGTLPTCTIGALAVNASQSCATTVTATSMTLPTQSMSVSGIDYDPKASNNSANFSTSVIAPDLVSSALSVATSGTNLLINDQATNQGSAASGTFTVSYYLSTDASYQTSDTLLCSRTITGLAAGTASPATQTSCTIPSVKAGSYYVIAVIDSGSAVTESNESNNTAVASVTIAGKDLIPTAATAARVAGSTTKVNVTDTAKNQGSQAISTTTYVRYYLSKDTVYDASDIPLASSGNGAGTCQRSFSSLAAGASSTNSGKTCYRPTGAASNTLYYVLVVDDATHTIAEYNETNNVMVGGTVQW